MLYTDAFKGTAKLYVGEGFSGWEDVLFDVMEVSPHPPLYYSLDPKHTHTCTHLQTNVNVQSQDRNIPNYFSALSCYGLFHIV